MFEIPGVPRRSVSVKVGSTEFLAAETLHGVGGLVFDAHGNRFANELGGQNCVTGKMWKDKPPFRLLFGNASITLDAES